MYIYSYPRWSGRRDIRRAVEQLVVLTVGEPHEGKVVPCERLRLREVLVRRVIVDVLKVRRVVV